MLNEESTRKVMKDFGLTGKETDVYLFLGKQGILKNGDITKRIKINKAQVYHILKNLQTKDLVESRASLSDFF
ncbi:MAG: TrmB protein [Thermoproteota archaeon]|nr:TrmB protein [Thermoproteota archaeon]